MGHGAGPTFVLSTTSRILHTKGGKRNAVYLGQWELAKFRIGFLEHKFLWQKVLAEFRTSDFVT